MSLKPRSINESNPEVGTDEAGSSISRRRALARLGLSVGVVYTAPMIVRLDKTANGQTVSCAGMSMMMGGMNCK